MYIPLKTSLSGSQWITKNWDTVARAVVQTVSASAGAFSLSIGEPVDIYQEGEYVRQVNHDGNGGVVFEDTYGILLFCDIGDESNLFVYIYNKITKEVEVDDDSGTSVTSNPAFSYSLDGLIVIDSYCIAGGILREVYHDGSGDITNNDISGHPLCDSREAYFKISAVSSLRFVNDKTIDSCENLAGIDDILFNDQDIPGILRPCYYPKIQKCDTLTFQFRSSYQSNVITVKNARTGATKETIYPTIKVQNINIIEDNLGYITNHGSGKCRVYYNGEMPIYITAGSFIKIQNSSVGSFDGDYTIESIGFDSGVQKNYLVIVKTYTGLQTRVNCNIKSYYTSERYNVFEYVVNFGTYTDGYYKIEIDSTDLSFDTHHSESEIFEVKTTHQNTVVIKYKNNDNAFDIDYQTGIINQIRVEGYFWKVKPGANRKVLRDCGELKKVSSDVYRRIQLETKLLPPYLHEKIAVIIEHDYFEVNGVEFQTEENYEISYINRFALCNADVTLEQVGWFDNDNSDDLGSVDEQNGYILANNGYLKR